jgi:hypothetical protein
LSQFVHRRAERDTLLYPLENEVFIIVAGTVVIYDHSEEFSSPKIVSYYRAGDIVGCEGKENNISTHPDLWLIT